MVIDAGATCGVGGVEGAVLGIAEVMGVAREAAKLGGARGRRG
jgi:hypothetical protein